MSMLGNRQWYLFQQEAHLAIDTQGLLTRRLQSNFLNEVVRSFIQRVVVAQIQVVNILFNESVHICTGLLECRWVIEAMPRCDAKPFRQPFLCYIKALSKELVISVLVKVCFQTVH